MTDKLKNDLLETRDHLPVFKAMTFQVDQTEYGIDIKDVRDIVRIQAITFFPGQPHYVKGLINLRGHIIPTMDIGQKFNKQARVYDDRTCIIVIEHDQKTLGVIVDRINEVKTFILDDIAQAPHTSDGQANDYLQGVGKSDDAYTLLLKTEKVMSHYE